MFSYLQRQHIYIVVFVHLHVSREMGSLNVLISLLGMQHVAEKLRSHAIRKTRIEMAPWAKAYTVDIKDINTELTLETEPRGQKIKDYKELFLNATVAQETQLKSLNKILIKGGQGFGKSSFAKKIYFDWSKQMFTEFDIVFFVSMALVGSCNRIEEEIIRQRHL